MNQKNTLQREMLVALKHPLSYGSFTNLMRLLLDNGGVDRKYIVRALSISFLSFATIPVRIVEKLIFGKQIENTQIKHPPIFIIGHWRSGTTYIHNLITQDPNLGYVTHAQAWAPECFLLAQKLLKNKLSKIGFTKRPMDNVLVSSDSPEEEEWALVNISPYGTYHAAIFPKKLKIMALDSEEIENLWSTAYISILKKAAFNFQEKRLVLKNPVNMARIKILLKIFPEAKFIHIYRNPYIVYASRQHSFQTHLPTIRLQEVNEEQTDTIILKAYQQIMQEFFSEKALIPQENLIEVKYEDFVGHELAELKRIYEQFKLPDFDKVEENFKNYLESNATYKTNKHLMDKETITKVYNACQFTIDKWQYSPPNSL
ncbi:sulfotransferase [Nostoc sp. FACHB-892]|uniref:sulfotransferase family protein n=1 Tax=Nostoc sp. FACHB-892 TaxID=2692843 RepID=UPI0016848A25|nr:sulfotransferase [Nostoc sp. FACHB-892]MBD2729719.1 sulfotransferase [Nostoc sp. FACHB-892]